MHIRLLLFQLLAVIFALLGTLLHPLWMSPGAQYPTTTNVRLLFIMQLQPKLLPDHS